MKTKCIFFFLVFGCCVANLFAQTNNWLWARSAVDNGGNYAIRSCTDPMGNLYVSGYFVNDTICFGMDTLFHTNNFGSDVFLVKYDGTGNVLWAMNFASGRYYYNDDNDHDIAADANGNVYFTAALFLDSAIYGSFTLINDSAIANTFGNGDVIVVKCNPAGNILWAKDMGGKGSELPGGICVDNYNNVFVTGFFNSDSIFFVNDTLTNSTNNGIHAFVIKYDSLGNTKWAREIAGNGWHFGRDVAVDAVGNIYVTGFFNGPSITFGSTTLTNDTTNNSSDIFVAKYNNAGNVLWAKSVGGIQADMSNGICTDANGNAIITGNYKDSIIVFGNDTLYNSSLGMDVFIAKYDPLGNVIWAKSAGGPDADWGIGICSDANNAIYVTGRFGLQYAVFGNDTCTNGGTSGTGDVFVVKYDAGGNELWTRSAVGNGDDEGNSICTNTNGDIYVSGYYWINISFGNIILTGGADVFLAKLSGTTGMRELSSDENFSIFPNPFSTSTTIQFTTTPKNAELNIYNLYGQEIKTIKNISANKIEIDRGDLSNGIYFVRLVEGNEVIGMGKVIVTD